MSDRQRRSLSSTQFYEFRSRYAGRSRGNAELILCQLANSEEIIGCSGVEVTTIFDSKIGGKTNGPLMPLMSNLAVSKQYRRLGIAEKLVQEVERIVRYEWGYDACYLYVEKRNKSAVKLYQKLGYKKVWVDKEATTLLPSTDGQLQTSSTTILCMKKRLSSNFMSKFLPFETF